MSEKITVTIDGEEYTTEPGKMVFDLCREKDIFVPGLCEVEYIDEPYGGCRLCLAEIETDRGTQVTTTCDTPVQDGMEITTDTEEVLEGRKMALELLLSEHTGDCVGPCSLECPASTDCQGYLAHIANGRPREATKLIKEKTPLAISLGRACFAPCEDECRRDMVEDPLAIRQLKLYAAMEDLEDPWVPEVADSTGKEVAIVGGGPAGLTAAYFLRLEGHDVKIYDMMPELGGMMRYGIPNYRLPKDELDQEIQWILDLGIEAETEAKMGEDFTLDELRDQYDATFVSTGAWESWIIPVEGKDLPGVMGGIDFLIDRTLGKEMDLGDKVVVVGCGNTAMDVARVARRLGKDATIAYRRTEEQAPANEEEIEEAKEEGIEFVFLSSPKKICGCEEEGVDKVTCAQMELGEPDESGRPKPIEVPGEVRDIEADSVILAIGQQPDLELLEEQGLENEKYTLGANEKFQTNFDDVFTAGDALIGASSIVECTGQGREAAYAMDAYLNGDLDRYEVPEDYTMPYGYVHEDEVTEEDLADYTEKPRETMPMRDADERIQDFEAIELGWDDETAQKEAERCLECGCLDRFECDLREYADMYDAEQHAYEGSKYEYEVDDSHDHIVREPGKCILCGSCVRTSEEFFGEGVVEFVERGLKSVVEPPFGDPLDEVHSDLIGALADACPTGAFEERLDDVKPGPHEMDKAGETYCTGCGLTCPAEVHSVNGRPVMLKPADDPVYAGKLCDKGKFDTIIRKGDLPMELEAPVDEVVNALEGRKVDVVIFEDTTLEEAEILSEIAASLDGTPVMDDIDRSTADLDDLLSADEIYVDEGVYRTAPVLKMFVKRARENGAELVEDADEIRDGVALLSEPDTDIEADKVVFVGGGSNAQGLAGMGSQDGFSQPDVVLVYGDVCGDILESIPDASIVHLTPRESDLSDRAELVVPIRSWLEKEGTMVNVFGEERELSRTVKSELPSNIDLLEDILNRLD